MENRRPAATGDSSVRAGAERGDGLVEVLVAATLFAALTTGVAQLFAMSARSLVSARQRTSALMLAVDRIEQLRAGGDPWGAPTGAAPDETEFLGAAGEVVGRGGGPPAGTVYRRSSSVRPRAAQPGVLTVEVRVGFGPGIDARVFRGASPHEVVVTTLLPAPGGP